MNPLVFAIVPVLVGGSAAVSFAGGPCCGTGDSKPAGEATQFVNADSPSTRPAGEAAEARPAEAILADLQAAAGIDAALPLAREFVDAYPDREESAQLFFVLSEYAEDDAEKTAYLDKLVEHHPDSQFARMAEGAKRQAEGVGKPFELTFDEVRSGETISLQDDLKGKVVVIDFWATWCGPCVAEMPKMKELYAKYKDQGVEFIGVSLDAPPSGGGREALLNFVEEREIPWPQYYENSDGESQFSDSWGIQAIPTIFIVAADGTLHSTEARGELETMIPELIAKRDASANAGQ